MNKIKMYIQRDDNPMSNFCFVDPIHNNAFSGKSKNNLNKLLEAL